jgi:hypothetical protein
MAETKDQGMVIAALKALRDDAHGRLLDNPDYRTLVAMDRAIMEITGERPVSTLDEDADKSAKLKPKNNSGAAPDVGGMSQADAAHTLLTSLLYEPVPIARLVQALNAHGITVGGVNPNINLSSVLSKDGRFRSVRFKERSCWWVKGRPFPGELDAQ